MSVKAKVIAAVIGVAMFLGVWSFDNPYFWRELAMFMFLSVNGMLFLGLCWLLTGKRSDDEVKK